MADNWLKIDDIPPGLLDGRPVLVALHDEWAGEARYLDGQWYEPNNDPSDSWGGPLVPTHYQEMPAPPGLAKNMRCPRCGEYLKSNANFKAIAKVRDVVGAKCADCHKTFAEDFKDDAVKAKP